MNQSSAIARRFHRARNQFFTGYRLIIVTLVTLYRHGDHVTSYGQHKNYLFDLPGHVVAHSPPQGRRDGIFRLLFTLPM